MIKESAQVKERELDTKRYWRNIITFIRSQKGLCYTFHRIDIDKQNT